MRLRVGLAVALVGCFPVPRVDTLAFHHPDRASLSMFLGRMHLLVQLCFVFIFCCFFVLFMFSFICFILF